MDNFLKLKKKVNSLKWNGFIYVRWKKGFYDFFRGVYVEII